MNFGNDFSQRSRVHPGVREMAHTKRSYANVYRWRSPQGHVLYLSVFALTTAQATRSEGVTARYAYLRMTNQKSGFCWSTTPEVGCYRCQNCTATAAASLNYSSKTGQPDAILVQYDIDDISPMPAVSNAHSTPSSDVARLS